MREVATLTELDLEPVLGFPVPASVVVRLAALDARLDRLERPWRGWRRYGWSVGSGHRLDGTTDAVWWGALGRILSFGAGPDDTFELGVDLWRLEGAPLVVAAALDVGCFCTVDHNIHTVAEQEGRAGDGVEVAEALAAAVTAAEGWVALELDPDRWRARAGLPGRPGAPTPPDQDRVRGWPVSPGC